MDLLDAIGSADLSIDRLVFHLIGPTAEHFQLLQEVPLGRFEGFFIDRIKAIGGGNMYRFSDASATRERLARILKDDAKFQAESEKLAEDFQQVHGGATAAGAFLVCRLRSAGQTLFALLKYDDESVLTYDVETLPNGKKRVTLDQVERTFVQNKQALQKIALVSVDEEAGELLVLDRQNSHKVARYFEGFLGARRVFEDDVAPRT